MKYPKIQTLWKRDENKKFTIMIDDYTYPEFENIKLWHVTEKIDGTNVRIFWNGEIVTFGGRTDNAQMPTTLLEYLQNTFTVEKLKNAFPDINIENNERVILFGEGYGPKIQKGGGDYREDVSFILFDVWITGWWMTRDAVSDIAKKLEIDEVPTLGIWTLDEIIKYVMSLPDSPTAKNRKLTEGVVARSHPLMLFRNGTPIMFKLKTEDYLKLDNYYMQNNDTNASLRLGIRVCTDGCKYSPHRNGVNNEDDCPHSEECNLMNGYPKWERY